MRLAFLSSDGRLRASSELQKRRIEEKVKLLQVSSPSLSRANLMNMMKQKTKGKVHYGEDVCSLLLIFGFCVPAS